MTRGPDFDAVAEAISPGQLAQAIGARKAGGSTSSYRCPLADAHTNGDRSPSLSIFRDGRRTAAKCHACGLAGSPVSVASKVWNLPLPEAARRLADEIGLYVPGPNGDRPEAAGLTLEQFAKAKRLDVEFLRSCGLRTRSEGRAAVEIPYRDADGRELRVRLRWALAAGEGSAWAPGDGLHLYGLDRLDAADPGRPVFVVEGETDCLASWMHDAVAVGVPGATAWRSEWAEILRDRRVYVWEEPDPAGARFARAVAGDLPAARIIRPANGRVKDLHELHVAVEGDWEGFRSALVELVHGAVPGADVLSESAPGEEEEGGRDLTHDGLALDLGDKWAGKARHVAAWGRWYLWDGAIWREDETLEHMTRARAFLRELADDLGEQKAAVRLRQAETVAKVLSLARSNVAQAASVGEWDRDAWLLGTPRGTVDLRTGELRDADPSDRITKATAVAPAPPGAPCPLWSTFLDDITAGDEALQAYMQRFFGYALTGSVREHAFVFGHGTGANGKGVTVNTMMGLMGDYALAIPTEMLMASQNERHPTELARLRGVRLAVGSETEQGTRWAEAKIKALTGGDTVAARFMRRDFFEFEPTFKLVVVGNHRPSLRGVDEAMRRRLHFVRFPVRIPPERRNEELEHDLEPEWPAILRWAIDGCLEWQERGLRPPETVMAATESYLEAEDAVAVWMDECCEENPSAFEPIGELFASWKRWAEDAGEFVGSKKRFGQELEDRGFERHRLGNVRVRGFKGLRLVSRASDDGGRR